MIYEPLAYCHKWAERLRIRANQRTANWETIMSPTTDPALRSFLDVATDSPFPIQNLPYGVFRRDKDGPGTIGVAIGEYVLDLKVVDDFGGIDTPALAGTEVFQRPNLNDFMALGKSAWDEARECIQRLLRADEPFLRDHPQLRELALVRQMQVEMMLPAVIGDYTDFYSSKEHATNVGVMLRGPDNALQPNWLHLPVAYHGRSSSIVVSGADVRRPHGQTRADHAEAPTFGPTGSLDFELEMGCFVGPGNPLGRPVPVGQAASHLFGMVLVNDWSARDIQRWEYVPLGPFLAKNFATSISPWVVPFAALEPFRCAGPGQQPTPLPYLRTSGDQAFDIHLEVWLETAAGEKQLISRSNFKHLYWNVCQQLAHHTSNGCNLRPGDLLASGTISGPTPDSYGSLLELAWKGTRPLTLGKEKRTFLADGDRLTLTGWCQGPRYRVGFGEVTGRILPAEV
jgi:fumarylacetoacetase